MIEIANIQKEYEKRIKQLTKEVDEQTDRANYWGVRCARLQVKIAKLEEKIELKLNKRKENK